MTYSHKFPAGLSGLSALEQSELYESLSCALQNDLKTLHIGKDLTEQLKDFYIPLASSLALKAKQQPAPLIVGISGAQGSGKSTLCALLKTTLQRGFNLKTVIVALDDLYCPREERKRTAQKIHPLLATRGVPGTHDVKLGLRLFDQLSIQEPDHHVAIPVFDKALDDQKTKELWRAVTTPCHLILFEGWCVGARPQDVASLASPVNELEAVEDPEGLWRSYVNQRLGDDYAKLFAALDLLIMLKIPDMACVLEWRSLQERKLAARHRGGGSTSIMNPAELQRFIMHYERLTRHMLEEMPEHADLVLRLNREHLIDGVRVNGDPLSKRS